MKTSFKISRESIIMSSTIYRPNAPAILAQLRSAFLEAWNNIQQDFVRKLSD